jgi:hypothetical protein
VKEESTEGLKVRGSDVSPKLSSILVINGWNVGKTVQYDILLLNGVDRVYEREVSTHNAIVCLSGIICIDTISGVLKYFPM